MPRKVFQHDALDSRPDVFRLCRVLAPPEQGRGGRLHLEVRQFILDRRKPQQKTRTVIVDGGKGSSTQLIIKASDSERDEDATTKGLQRAPRYVALSYTWRSSTPSEPEEPAIVAIGGASLGVTQNLAAFLETVVQTKDFETWYYIDQISIDQSNIPERNSQVRLMADIYHHADSVCIWLGPSSDHGARAMKLLNEYKCWMDEMSKNHKFRRLHDPAYPFWASLVEGEKDVIRRFFGAPYWGRLWILQEIFHARLMVLRCGLDRHPDEGFVTHTSLDQLQSLFSNAASKDDEENEDDEQRSDAASGEKIQFKGECIRSSPSHALFWTPMHKDRPRLYSLFQAVRKSLTSQCVEAKDKIFGVQGFVTPGQRVDIDYALAPEQVFWDAFEAMKRHGFDGSAWQVEVLQAEVLETLSRLCESMKLSDEVIQAVHQDLERHWQNSAWDPRGRRIVPCLASEAGAEIAEATR